MKSLLRMGCRLRGRVDERMICAPLFPHVVYG